MSMLVWVRDEAERAQAKYGDFASMHEAYGVLASDGECEMEWDYGPPEPKSKK